MLTPTVQISDDLRGCHPLITKTRRLLKQGKPDERHLKYAVAGGTMSVRVSSGAIDRALQILEAIIRACESRAWIVAAPDDESSARVHIGQDPVSFGMSEKILRFEIETNDPAKRHLVGSAQLSVRTHLSPNIGDF